MRLRRTFTYLVGAVSIAAATHTIDAEAATLSLVGSSTKICQLIGDSDWETGAPTAARTFTNFGLAGVDLGFPVDSGPRSIDIRRAGPPGTLYFLFGEFRARRPSARQRADGAAGRRTRSYGPNGAARRCDLSRPSTRRLGSKNLRASNGASADPAGIVQRADRRRVCEQHALRVLLD